MQSLSVANKLLPGIFFLLLAVFSPLSPCVAVTIEEIYDDDDGEGFLDETELTQAEKDFLSRRGNDAETLGEARKNAFEHATSLLESTLTNTNTIRIGVEFVIFSSQEDPNNQGECLITTGTFTAALAGSRGRGYPSDRLDEGDENRLGLGTAYPLALHEALLGREFNEQEADIAIRFSKCIPFYYGFTGSAPANELDFVQLSLHETMHGLGFLEQVEQDGDFPTRVVQITETLNGIIIDQREATIKSRTIYDEQLYSETNSDLLINLSGSQRAAAITSGTRLLWEGTDDGRNSCSYGQRMAELKSSSAKAQDGKPRLHAPSTYDPVGSVSHTHANTEDLMEAFVPGTRNMDLTLGMLKDMGWEVSAEGFPPGCEPTGITVAPTSGLVTTEGGGVVKFEVTLESEPSENVTIPIVSSDTSEGVPDSSELTFTPQNWDTAQEVTVTGVDDDSRDGPQNYFITVDKAESDDRFYDAFPIQTVSLRNDDNEPFPELSIEDASAGEEAGSMDFTVSLSPKSTQTVTVRYAITNDTARQGSDYTASPATATLTFAPGEDQKTISASLINDNIDEDDETFTVTLSNPQNAVLDQNRGAATGTIRDNDETALSIGDASGFEGTSINFTVTLSLQSTQTVSVGYEIADGSAREGSDYTASPATATLTFAPGQTQKTIRVPLQNDDINEPDETFTVIIRNPQNAALDRNFAVGTIINRHRGTLITPPPPPPPAVTVSFGSSFYSVTEGETVAVRVTLSEDPERTVTIPITIDQATSAATEDYSLSSTSVTFASGETLKDTTLTATDDNVDDDGEVVVLAFGTLPQNVSGGTLTSATVTIRDISSPRLGAEAGENRTVAQREEVILKGSATSAASGEPTYRWAYTGTRNDIELRTPDAATCSFTAPGGLSEDTVLVFRLVVTDSRGASAEDTVSITVTEQKVAFSSKDGGGTVTLSDGSTLELTVNRDAGSPSGNPVIILSSDLLQDINGITFHISAQSPEAPPSGFRLEGFVADIDLGVELTEGETATVCLPAPQGTQNPALYHYDEESSAWERLESRLETVDGVGLVCAETDAFSLFGVFVAERSEPPVNTPTTGGTTEESGGGGCAISAEAKHGTESAAVNLLLIITVLFSLFFRKSRLIT